MRFALALALGTIASAAPTITSRSGQVAFEFSPSGFPNTAPGSAELQAIEKDAHGTLPNGALPAKIADTSAAVWSLIAFNELFEVAFFTSLLNNITNSVPGYDVKAIGSHQVRDRVAQALQTVIAQEKLHALGANGVLKTANRTTVQPCKYVFPVSNFDDAIAFAATFTDVVLGTLQEALTNFGLDGDTGFLGLVGSVIGQEGEQNGFYRLLSKEIKMPSALPFLTASSGAFAGNALNQLVIVPNSCPTKLDIPSFGKLTALTPNIGPKTTTIKFTATSKADLETAKKWSVVYINQQNKPVAELVQNVE